MSDRMSSRTVELFHACIDAFVDGDRWIRMRNASTARYTGVALVSRGLAEFDTATMRGGYYSMRIRLATTWADDNGWTSRDWQAARAERTAGAL